MTIHYYGSSYKLKTESIAAIIVGVLILLAGITFALQGDGIIGGSGMTGVSFWIYAGSGVAVVGFIIMAFGIFLGSKKTSASKITSDVSPS